MKKLSIFGLVVLVLLSFTEKSNAQSTATTASVNVSIDLTTAVISINLGASPDVNFIYSLPADYVGVKTESKTAHLTVVSNLPYDISVKAGVEFASTSSNNLPLNLVKVAVDPATSNGGNLTTASLALTPAKIVEGAAAAINAVYNVNYTIPDAAPLLGLAPEVYTTTVTYTATHI